MTGVYPPDTWDVWDGKNLTPNGAVKVAYRHFYNPPNNALLSYLGLRNPLAISITNFKFTGVSGGNNVAYAGEGGKITFNSNVIKVISKR